MVSGTFSFPISLSFLSNPHSQTSRLLSVPNHQPLHRSCTPPLRPCPYRLHRAFCAQIPAIIHPYTPEPTSSNHTSPTHQARSPLLCSPCPALSPDP
ncbi:hypothetical protein SLEP1_g15207 [Rubroshorea leprosula]|uniref:Uncharacterized protein n=1 Tax=Rubroshorea leprosula TaxID=152421 RepID=A0AAV5IVN3_9ROSI|nr:hypothetical protein SLEP1_g15207 [Rubroshorea leprosula]